MALIGQVDGGKPVTGPLTPVDLASITTPNVVFGPNQYDRRIELLVSNAPLGLPGVTFVEQGVVGQVENKPPVVVPEIGGTTPSVSVTATPLPPQVLDLSQLRIRFQITAADLSSPNAAAIRIYNLSDETSQLIQDEYVEVIINAGYQGGNFGKIFQGSIKQFRRGRESPTDSYLDILAADGDIPHNFTVISETFPSGTTCQQQIERICNKYRVPIGYLPNLNGINPNGFSRGKVAFGMFRSFMNDITNLLDCTWSIQQGQIQIIPTDSYIPGEAVKLNSFSGMIGIPEQTDQGIKVRSLINPKVRIGGLVQINQRDIVQLVQQDPNAAPLRFDQRTGIQYNAKINNDGFYRVFVVEYIGDSRGQEWYQDMICLSVIDGEVTAQ